MSPLADDGVGRSDLPDRDALPRWAAPLPAWLEDVAFRFVWLIVAVNLAGTAFGFWYYRGQFARTPAELWVFVPDSPAATLLIAIPSAVKVFNYLTTLWRGKLRLTPAMLFSIGMVSTFISGGLTGIILADSALDIQVHDTYFVVAHFHVVMGLSAVLAMLAGVYHWFPKMFGRMMNKNLGYAHFWVTFISAYGVFIPMHFVGLAGAPRRYYENSALPMLDGVADLNIVMTGFAIFGAVGQLLFLYNFFYSIFRGQKAPQNPWRSNTLARTEM